jgi:amino acid transporter
MPTSGGLYYSGAVLAPKYKPLVAWTIGWSNWLAQVTWAPSVDYALANMIYSLVSMKNAQFAPTHWQVYLLTVALLTIHAFIASLPTRIIARMNNVFTIYNLVALLIVFVTLLAGNQRRDPRYNSNSRVWLEFVNQTEWPNGIAVLMSFLAAIWSNAGFDGPFHLSEECSNASIAAPRAIVMTTTIAGTLGWALLLVIAYTIGDISTVLSSPVGLPFATYCDQVVGPDIAQALVAITAICSFIMGQACMITASRVAFAYARDGCFPFSPFWSHVNSVTKTPVRTVWGNYAVGLLLCLLIFDATAISAIFSLGGTAAYIAFIIPVILKVTNPSRFRPGPWNLGQFSPFVAIYAICFVLLMIPILQFPQTRGADLNPPVMNWTVVVYFGPLSLALFWYAVSARKWFTGPKVSLEHLN